MIESRDNLLAIGAFAGASFLSVKALRLYDQLGLLKPSHTDPQSGYRYYGRDQLRQARLIRMLRQMEMPLAAVRRVLAAAPAGAGLEVLAHVRELEARTDLARRLVRDVLAHINEEDGPMTLDVQVKEFGERPVVSISRRIKVDQLGGHIGDSLAALYAYAEAQGGQPAGAPFGIYHGPVNHDEDGPMEVCLPLAAPLAGGGEIAATVHAPLLVASVTLAGDQCAFPAVLKGYDATHDWIMANGYQFAGSPLEIWLQPPGPGERLEIAWPFREQDQAAG